MNTLPAVMKSTSFISLLLWALCFSRPLNAAPTDSTRAPREKPTTTTERVPKATNQSGAGSNNESCDGGGGGSFFLFSSTSVQPQIPMRVPILRSRLYTGVGLGGGIPSGDVNSEYNGGFLLKGIAGVFFSNALTAEFHIEQGWYKGQPQFDYVTTTTYPNGDTRQVKEIPLSASLRTSSLGVGVRYWFLRQFEVSNDVVGVGVGGAMRYIWFTERVDLRQETYFNQSFQSEQQHVITHTFSRPAFSLDLSVLYALSPASPWWLELTVGYDFSSRQPLQQQPTPLDWNEYRGQVYFGLTVKFSLADLTR